MRDMINPSERQDKAYRWPVHPGSALQTSEWSSTNRFVILSVGKPKGGHLFISWVSKSWAGERSQPIKPFPPRKKNGRRPNQVGSIPEVQQLAEWLPRDSQERSVDLGKPKDNLEGSPYLPQSHFRNLHFSSFRFGYIYKDISHWISGSLCSVAHCRSTWLD